MNSQSITKAEILLKRMGGDCAETAKNLYAFLRHTDAEGLCLAGSTLFAALAGNAFALLEMQKGNVAGGVIMALAADGVAALTDSFIQEEGADIRKEKAFAQKPAGHQRKEYKPTLSIRT